jgi:CRISPR-associated protein Cas6
MTTVDLLFPVVGTWLPTDHAYGLYGALSRVVPAFHNKDSRLRLAPINGDLGEKGTIRLFDKSRLRIRLPAEEIGTALALTGQSLEIDGATIRLRAPVVEPLYPVTALRAKVVVYKEPLAPMAFLEWTRKRLDEIGIQGEAGIPLTEKGGHAGEPRRQVIRVKGHQLVGYALLVEGLTAEESLLLQEQGLGTHRKMGCGFFLPHRPRAS